MVPHCHCHCHQCVDLGEQKWGGELCVVVCNSVDDLVVGVAEGEA
jgi:hypothetical protein